MAKKIVEEAGDNDQQSFRGPKKSDIQSFFTRVGSLLKSAGEIAAKTSEVVADFVKEKHFHAGAGRLALRLDKMDAIKRAEFLFHFDLLREARGWDRMQKDMLPDRAEVSADNDDDKDVRPRNLRQPDAETPNDKKH